MRLSRTAKTALFLIAILAPTTAGAQYAEEPPVWVHTWAGFGSDIPGSVAVDSNGDEYIMGFGRFWRFEAGGSPWLSQVHQYFYGAAIAGPGQVLLTGSYPPIRLVDRYGRVVWEHGTYDGTPSSPTQFDVAFHSDFDDNGNFYVTDWGYHQSAPSGWRAVHKCGLNSGCSQAWGTYGTGSDQFIRPTGVAYDAVSGSVFIMDSANHRLKQYTTNGVLLDIWTGIGSGNTDGCVGPEGIDADHLGNIYVADTCNDRILKFDAAGDLLTAWGSPGEADGQFTEPSDVHVSPDGTIYVVDRWNYRVQVFRFQDSDTDGVGNSVDICRDVADPHQLDLDLDGIGDACDNCPFDANPNQWDSDGWYRIYDFDYVLDANGGWGGPAGWLNDGAWLDPDKAVHFERRNTCEAIVDGSGYLTVDRTDWQTDDRFGLVLEDPLPDQYVFSIEDLFRSNRSGFYLAMSVSYTPDDSLPSLDANLLPHATEGLYKLRIMPNGYWTYQGRFVVLVSHVDEFNQTWGWTGTGWQPGWYELTAIPTGYHPYVPMKYQIIKDESGYSARITRMDTGAVVVETTPVAAESTAGFGRSDFSSIGTRWWWLGRPAVNRLDYWKLDHGDGSGDACDNCPMTANAGPGGHRQRRSR